VKGRNRGSYNLGRNRFSIHKTPPLAHADRRVLRSQRRHLPADWIRAIEEGRARQSGRAFNPSSVVERILRAHYAAKPKRDRRGK